MRISYSHLRLVALLTLALWFWATPNLLAQYCAPSNIGSYNNYYISNVSLGDINNSSSGSTGGYTYYSNISATDIMVGETIEGTVTVTLDGWNKKKHTLIVWMNFNNSDDDFEDNGEQFTFTVEDKSKPSGLKTIQVSISIPVPSTAQVGNSVMRIGFREKPGKDFTPCDFKYNAGEIEDYNINFISSSSSDSDTSSPEDTEPEYEEPKNIGDWNVNYISKVSFGSFNNESSGETGNYRFYDDIETIKAVAGETLEGIVQVTIDDWNNGTNILVVWMNFNEDQDDDFEDEDERFLFLFKDENGAKGGKKDKGTKTVDVSISIPIPEDVKAMSSVIRIGLRTGTDTNFTSTDYNYQSGEVEDYKMVYTTSSSQSSSSSSSVDTDGDGVNDDEDLDDDNDGILDVVECSDFGKAPLLNSDFEDLDITNGLDGGGTDVVPTSGIWKGDASNIPHWQSSDPTNNHLEIWHNTQGAGNDAGGQAFSGTQWAEINATTNDGLYQDIATTPGDVLHWSFAHRKRTGYAGSAGEDVMRLLIGDPNGTLSSQGDFASAGDASWTEHSGTYTVPPGQTTTRLTFTAISVASGGGTSSGNFVDKVQLYVLPNCEDADADGYPDYLDIDSDNDGIPDNVEAQPTVGYVAPSNTFDADGVDNNYTGGITTEDTDGDGIPDFLDSDSDNDGITDIKENGMADTFTAADVDGDGLNNAFETTGVNDAVWDVNEDIEDPTDLSILPDADGDLASGGDLDYRDYFDANPPTSASIDFDGVDDYLDSDLDLTGYSQATVMAWIKLDENFTNSSFVINFGNLNIEAHSSRQIWMKVNDATITSHAIGKDKWAHVALVFDSSASSEKLKGYINGVQFGSSNDASLASAVYGSANKFTIGARALDHAKLFYGSIDEVRVFDVALSDDQMQKIIYQEVENVSGNVSGKVVPKAVVDSSTSAGIPWADIKAYYPMTDIKTSLTTDFSGNGFDARLYNITTVMDQTAPMPYETIADGALSSASTWVHGDDWNLNSLTNTGYTIVKINHDVTLNDDFETLGLYIASDKTLTVNNDSEVRNNWYLELNGTIDLMDDSQLLQTENSDLVTSASGKILRRQEGTASPYWYNYWGSPVGQTGESALSDNNGVSNNANNAPFKLNMLKNETGFNMQFTSGYTGSGNISKTWLYTFINGLTYWDWKQIAPTTSLNPGVGYTQKGTGNAGSEQQYIFEGKPNNGTILVNVTDKGGPGSVPNKSKTEYLLGNPYPSALDIHKFIDDNNGIIDGTLNLWQQWAGSSHNLNEYHGGYAQVNKLGSCRAYQFVGFYGAHNGSQDGTIVPTRYLPVGQGFVVEIVANGQVEFNNGQRVFVKESDADGDYNNGSTFSRSANSGKTSKEKIEKGAMQKVRLEFKSISGPKTRRELLLGFSNYTRDSFDFGYEAKCTEKNNNDLSLVLDGQNMTMQAYSEITDDKVVPLNFRSSGKNTFEIKISELENIDKNRSIYLRDNLTGEYFNLSQGGAYQFSSEAGVFNSRFEMVFQDEQQSLSTEEAMATESFMYYQNKSKTFYAKKLDAPVSILELVNMRGQRVLEMNDITVSQLEAGLRFDNVAVGTYVVCLRSASNQVLTKKIIVN